MIEVVRATAGEVAEYAPDPLCAWSAYRYVIYKDGVKVCLLGVSTASLTSNEGYPWFVPLRPDLYSKRELVRYARAALMLWSKEFEVLHAVAAPGEHEGWFRFLGFQVDKVANPLYAGGKPMVYMRYVNGKS